MARRRMFSREITESDAFNDIPLTSQALYFHFGMVADDRGYVNNPKKIIRAIGATAKDLEYLITYKFVLQRPNGLILIKGWRINNTIQPTRIVETKFVDDLINLYLDENNSYTEKETSTSCQQIVSSLSPQYRLDKYRLVENSIDIDINQSIIEDEDTY